MRYVLSFVSLMLLLGGITFSQNVIRPKIACPNNVWVNSYNGVLFYQRADLSIPNRNMPLEAVFYYNSSSNTVNYGYGNGWSLGYEYRYIVDSLGIIIETGDGRQDLYGTQASSPASFEAPAGVFSTLTTLPTGGYTLTTKEGTVYTFADTISKRVTQLRDRNNNILNFAYTDGNLTSISDVSGRSITMAWADGLLTTLGTNIDDRTWHYAYDTIGNLVSVTNPMGYTVHYGYNRDNRISRFTDEAGYSTFVTYNDDGMAHRIKTDLTDKSIRYEQSSRQTVIVDYLEDGNNQFTTYRWDTLGRVIEKTGNCCGYTSKLEYDGDNNVILSEDANGNVTTCTYDGNGNMLTITDPMGYTESYIYTTDGYNNISTYTDKLGHQYTFSYDANGNLTTINDPLGNTIQITYNNYGQALTVTDAKGYVNTYGYDSYGNKTSVTDAEGKTAILTYTPMGLVSTEMSPKNDVTLYSYDLLDRLTSIVDPLGNITRYEYDATGNVLKVTDANNHATVITYNAFGEPLVITNADGDSVCYVYNAKQKVVEQRVGSLVTRYSYDDRDRVVMEITPNGDTVSYSYDGLGNVISAFLPNGHILEYSYDAMSRLIEVNDQYGSMGRTIYNAFGDVMASITATGDSTLYTYDALRQITSVRDAQGNIEQYAYDANGNVVTYTDAMGQTLSYTYNGLNAVLTETDALNNVTTYAYDDDGNLASVTDANGNVTSYQYDANDNPTLITFANGKTRRTWYDGVGNAIKEQDESGSLVQYSYDAAERLTQCLYPDGTTETYSYTPSGDLLTANNSDANITFSYSLGGMLLSETMNGKTTFYQYNTHQNTIAVTYPSGRGIVEHYDLRNRLQTITEGNDTIASFTYDGDNYISSRTYNNGTATTYTFDATKRLVGLADMPSIQNYTMHYDADGNMTAKISNINTTPSETYQYDMIHRLVGFKSGQNVSTDIPNPTEHIQYALDALGNRSSMTRNGSIVAYNHNATNAYTMVGNNSYQYDADGNLIADGVHTYQYDYNNNMVSVDNGATAIYKYDALHRRIEKQVIDDTLKFYYSGYKLLEERDGDDNIQASYIVGRGVDNVLQMLRGENRYYYHRNHLGSIVAITDSIGNVVEQYEYDPFGNTTIKNAFGAELPVSAIGNRYMFTSREYDIETGLYYFRARSLYPLLGRFLQSDPLLYIDGYNYYNYVNNMPLKYIDADGNRNVIIDFFFGGCLDFKEGWGCDSWADRGKNLAWCALDIVSLIPFLQAAKAAKLAKLKKLSKFSDLIKDLTKKAGKVCGGGSIDCVGMALGLQRTVVNGIKKTVQGVTSEITKAFAAQSYKNEKGIKIIKDQSGNSIHINGNI